MKYWVYLLFFTMHLGFAQKESNNWYFGNQAGVNFNSGSPIALTDGMLITDEGCASISDAVGDLLFYTDGISVWNKNHQVMQNGTGLLGHPSSSNAAIIIPKPSNSNIYYIFTIDAEGRENGLRYSEVDLSLDGGLGGVTSNKNIMLNTQVTEQVTAVKRITVDEYWVVSHNWGNNEFLAFNVSSLGVNTNPVVSSAGSPVLNYRQAIGCMKIAPKGNKLAVARLGYNVELFDFNLASGVVSNAVKLMGDDLTEQYYGVEFSPNSDLLYATKLNGGLFQFDISLGTNASIINSIVDFSHLLNGGVAALQLAIDGKIYVSEFSNGGLGVINSPNLIGVDANYQPNAVNLLSGSSKLGLPPFIQSYFREVAVFAENLCSNSATIFTLDESVDSAVWNFDDPNSGLIIQQ